MSLPAPSWSAQPAAAPHRCPFNRQAYVSGLTHLGQADIRPASPAVILRRTIRGNSRVDGLGAWPYVWIDNEADIADLRAAYRDFVTLTLVTQPGYRPAAAERNAVFFKDHYVFDPSREFPQLSKTTRKQVRRATKTYECEIVTDVAQRLEAANLYQALKRRKNIAAGFFDRAAYAELTAAAAPGTYFPAYREPL